MNVFLLDRDPKKCSEYICDQHLSMQILNIRHILFISMSKVDLLNKSKRYNVNHPFVIWSKEEDGNFLWLRELGIRLCEEFSYRYSDDSSYKHNYEFGIRNTHPDEEKILFDWEKEKESLTLTKAPQCIPDHFKNPDTIKSYRDYYLSDKSDILKYTKRNVPYWIENLGMGEHR